MLKVQDVVNITDQTSLSYVVCHFGSQSELQTTGLLDVNDDYKIKKELKDLFEEELTEYVTHPRVTWLIQEDEQGEAHYFCYMRSNLMLTEACFSEANKHQLTVDGPMEDLELDDLECYLVDTAMTAFNTIHTTFGSCMVDSHDVMSDEHHESREVSIQITPPLNLRATQQTERFSLFTNNDEIDRLLQRYLEARVHRL